MIKTDIIELKNGNKLVYRYSSKGYKLRNKSTGKLYNEVYDPITTIVNYEETTIKIEENK